MISKIRNKKIFKHHYYDNKGILKVRMGESKEKCNTEKDALRDFILYLNEEIEMEEQIIENATKRLAKHRENLSKSIRKWRDEQDV